MSPWTVQRRRRRNLSRFAVLLAMSIALVGVISSAQATPESQDAEAIGNAIENFADRLSAPSDALGEYQDLAKDIPLVDLAPGDPDALDLSELLKTYLPAGTFPGPFTSMADLAGDIEALDDQDGVDIDIQFGSGTLAPGQAAVSQTATSITIPIHAERAVSQPLDFTFVPGTNAVEIKGGSLDLDFDLDTTLTFNVDSSAITTGDSAPTTAVSLVPPSIALCAVATGSVGLFTARFGFTDVNVSTDNPATSGTTEAATVHLCNDVDFQDPDSAGGITRDEWTASALTELATAHNIDGDPGADLSATFYVDASLVNGDAFATNGTADASIAFSDPDLSNGFDATPDPTLGALGDWQNVTAGDVANGLTQFVASLAGSQNQGDAPLPFLKKSLTETFDAVKPLTDYTALLTNAQVGCGTEPGDADSFPTGFTDNLTDGTPVYCRARTQGGLDDDSVQWVVPAGAPVSITANGTADATLGNATVGGGNPTADAVFEMTADGNFAIELTWDANPAHTLPAELPSEIDAKKAIPRPGTAQELFTKLAAAAGLDTTGVRLAYASSTKALTFRLQKENFSPAPVGVNANLGDLLRSDTNLSGLKDLLEGSASASFQAGVSDIDFDVTFGVLLLPDTTDISPLRGTATAGAGLVLTDTGANFTDGDNDPRLAQVVRKTNAPAGQCTIAAITQTALTCAPGGTVTWSTGDAYDVDGGLIDRFFMKVDNAADQPELAVGDINVTGSLSLTGKVGILGVTAGGSGTANTFHPGTAFQVAKDDGADSVLRIDIKTPDPLQIDTGSLTTIPDAIGVGELLFHLDSDHLSAVCSLKATAGLGISAEVNGTDIASGGIAVDWPTVFKPASCEPDLDELDIAADTDFNANLKQFDPFPSASGTHNGGNGEANLEDTGAHFDSQSEGGDPTKNTFLNLTLRNKTTGGSCTITTIDATHLNCTLTGGTRNGTTNNSWNDGDEYEVEGNALALIGVILDHLDELVDLIDQVDPTLTEKEIPLVGVSTKEIVGKIQSVKQTIDELRGQPLAEIDCIADINDTQDTVADGDPVGQPTLDSLGRPFDFENLPDGTTLWCRAVSTIEPDSVLWKGLKGTVVVTPDDAFIPDGADAGTEPDPAPLLDPADPTSDVRGTVGPDPVGFANDARVKLTVSDGSAIAPDDTTIDEWQIQARFTDAAGEHTVEFPSTTPPQSLQDLADTINEKLGVNNVVKLDLLDLPAAGAGPITTGTALGTSDANTLQSTEDFANGTADPVTGNLLINKDAAGGARHCTITLVQDNSLECGAAGVDMDWGAGDDYEIVGNGTKDLVVSLNVGYCSGGGLCEPTDTTAPAVQAPLNVSDDFADIIAVETQGDIELNYDASAQLDIGVPIKLDLTPDVVVLDTTSASIEANLSANDIGLEASIGPIGVKLGTAVATGVGVGKVGAHLSLDEDGIDAVPNNETKTFTDFFTPSNLTVDFAGDSQDCDAPAGAPVEASGHACALLSVEAVGVVFDDPITIECNIGTDPLCDATLPTSPVDLESLLAGQPLDWTQLIAVLPQILANLEESLDGAAQDVHIPLIGDTLDAGANVVGVFNDNVVTPFADLVADLKTAGNVDGDGDVDAYDLAKITKQFILDELGPGAGGADLLRNTNGIPADPNADGDIDDIVVTPLCGSGPDVCADGEGVTGLNLIKDFRVTFRLGQAIDGDVPFDIGLRGLPIRLTGGVHGGGSWSVLVDFGLAADSGAYIMANGKKSIAASDDTKANWDPDTPGADNGPGVEDDTPPVWNTRTFLEDKDANFTNTVELGMWLQNVTTNEGCRITKKEATKLYCDDFGTGTAGTVEWHITATDNTPASITADQYEIRTLHAPDTTGASPGDGGASELTLTGTVSMGDLPADDAGFTCTDDRHDYASPGEPVQLTGFSEDRCLAGELAFLAVTIRDKDGLVACGSLTPDGEEPTALCLEASLDFRKSGSDRVTLSDLISGEFELEPTFGGKANVDVRFRTGLNFGQSAGFPSVLGKFHLFWQFSASPDNGLDFGALNISFNALNLDAGKFISEFLGPIVKDVKKITSPLMPVVELLQGEIPIISDLSKLVGEGPVTVLDVLEAISENDLSMLRSVLQFVKFVNSIPSEGNLLIPLGSGAGGGSFTVLGDRAGEDQPLPEDAGDGITPGGGTSTNLLSDLATKPGTPYGAADDPADECEAGRGSTFGVCGLTFPFLGNAGEIFGVLMGKDATLVRYDAGTFKAGAGFGFCFPPILIGPVPVQICIGGSFEVQGRFAIGYDTSGLRKVLDGGTGTHLLDGIFLDDYDATGQEVPEVKFIGTVYAEGAVSVYIFKVGIRGEIIFTTALDLHEDAPTDGKLRIEEIISRLNNPICLFDVSGKIEAALSAFVEIDLFITSVEFSIEIVRITLLEFKFECEPEPPVLARVNAAKTTLTLHMGSLTERQKRNIQEEEINEKFTVRQMESYGPESPEHNGETRFSVQAFGLQQDYFLVSSAVNGGTATVVANADDGEDVLSLLPGGNSGTKSEPGKQNPPVPFTAKGDISAGTENDEITTGDANDEVDGDAGDDRLITGKGADIVNGGAGNDKIDVGEGDDVNVHGDGDHDNINGGKGADILEGEGGNDVISAGPDNPAATSVDELRGEDGSDTLTADGGNDKLYGDEILTDCTADGADSTPDAGDNSDSLIGSDGDDEMYGGEENDQLDGGNGNDLMCGGGGNDEIVGGANRDTVEGGSDDDNIVGGTDNTSAGSPPGGDVLHGGPGRDYMLGDEGTLTRDGGTVSVLLGADSLGNDSMNGDAGDDFMWGQGGTDAMNGNENEDEMRGGTAVDTMNGNDGDDEMFGEGGEDVMHGNANNDVMRGGPDNDIMDGDADTDEMYGDGEADVMRGGDADDYMRGGGGPDEMEGNANTTDALPLNDAANPIADVNSDLDLIPNGNAWDVSGGGDGDVMFGDADEDDMIGGSQGGSPPTDGGDTMLGNVAQDVIVGDNGDVSRPGGFDPDGTTTRSVSLTDATAGGPDWIQGNDENDDVYAGGAGDLVHGDAGDDYVEGNGGSDGDGDPDTTPDSAIGLYGDTGQDDLIGGTNQGNGGIGEGADDIWGGQGHDVIAGDNADITRAAGSDCPAGFSQGYDCNTFRVSDAADVVIRRIQIWDVDTTTFDPPAGTSDGDTIGGQDAHDRMYGQGGDDAIEGGGADDFAFGNAGRDTINGGIGQDDLVGGTGRTDSATPSSATDGRIDVGDVIQGEADFDAVSGDNARIVRQTQDGDTGDSPDDTGLWKANTFNNAVDRVIALMDVATTTDDAPLTNSTSGNDELLGGDADDVVYGQGGNDGISGGNDQDLLEGNANGTGNAPDPAGTYGAAWPTFAGDVIHGDAGADDAGGGTGRIYRMVAGVETQDPASGVDGRKDAADTIFGDGGGDALAGDNTVIERALAGGQWILDDLHDPDALDVVRRIMRQRDVATTTNLAPLTNGTSGGDVIFGNDGVDVVYGQGADDQIQGNAQDDHLEGNANDDTITGNEGQDDVIGGTGRTFSNDEATAAAGRIDNPTGDDAANDTLHGGDGAGGVATGDDDLVLGDNGTVDRELGSPIPTPDKLPFNGTWQEASWDEPAILRVTRLLDVAMTANTAPETNGTNGDDTMNGEANEDLLFGQGANDTIKGDDADLDNADPGDAGADDYIEGNGGTDLIHGNLGEDDITGGGSAATGVLDANRDGTLDPTRSGETLRDTNDLIAGDNGDGTIGDNDVIAGDNARIQRPLASGDWRIDAQRKDVDAEPGAQLRDVLLFDVQKVVGADGFSADPGESGPDTISGNGGEDIMLGQGNGALADAYGTEDGLAGQANCQNVTTGPGTGAIVAGEEAPNGDDDNDDLPDLNDPQCKTTTPGDTLNGETGEDYIEGNQGSDNAFGGEGEDDVVGGSSANTGHLNVILPPGDRDPGFAPGALTEVNVPFNLIDGHDYLQGNAEDDTVVGDNGFVDRYLGGAGAWLTIAGPGGGPYPETGNPNPEPARGAWTATDMVRRDVTTKQVTESPGAFGNDFAQGGGGKDDVYGLLGNDWLEGNEEEDAIVGDMGKVVGNQLAGTADGVADPALNQFIAPNQPFLGATINRTGQLKREVVLYAFTGAQAGKGHDVALGGEGNDWIHTGPGQDLANGNAGDDRIHLGDNDEDKITDVANGLAQAHDQVDAAWGGAGHDHLWGGYGADYLDVRPRSTAVTPGLVPTSDPETWFQIAGAETSHNGVVYGQQNFENIDYLYGGWDQDSMQANEGDNGPNPGDRLLDWGGSYNGYYLCPSTFGDWVTTRAIAPGLIAFLQTMSWGDGAGTGPTATQAMTAGTSAFRETAIVFSNEVKNNTNPIHPDTPGHFTCGPGVP